MAKEKLKKIIPRAAIAAGLVLGGVAVGRGTAPDLNPRSVNAASNSDTNRDKDTISSESSESGIVQGVESEAYPLEYVEGLSVTQQAELDIMTRVAMNQYVSVAMGDTVRITYANGAYIDVVNPIISTVHRYDEASGKELSITVVASRTTGSDGSAARLVDTYYLGIDGVIDIGTLDEAGQVHSGLPNAEVGLPVKTHESYKDDAGNWHKDSNGLTPQTGDVYHFVVDVATLAENPDYNPVIPENTIIGAAYPNYDNVVREG